MSHAVSLTVLDSTPHVAPGARRDLWLRAAVAAKGGGEPRHYRVDVVGLQGRWYDVVTRDVDLGAGDEKSVGLSIHPPADAALLSGRYPFRVRLLTDDGHVAASAAVALVVGTGQALELRVDPAEAAGSAATFTLTLVNAMSWPATVLLDARADAAGLRLHISPHGPLVVPAGGQCQAALAVASVSKAARAGSGTYTIEVRGVLPGHEGDAHAELTRSVQFTPRRARARVERPARRAPRLPMPALPRLSFPRRRPKTRDRALKARQAAGRRVRPVPLGIAAAALLALLAAAVGMRQVGGAFVADRKPATSPRPARSATPIAVIRSATRGVPVAVARRTRVARPVGQTLSHPTATASPSHTATPLPSSTVTPQPSSTATPSPPAGIATPLPAMPHSPLLVARNRVSFGSHRIHTTSGSETINLVNVGQSPLVVEDVTVKGADARDFSLAGTCRHTRLVPYDGCALRISFRALAPGARQASISIRDRSGQQLGVIAVSGRGL